MGIKLIFYNSDYRNHPTYKQLDKLYGDSHENEKSLDSELSDINNVTIRKNIYKTEHWIVSKGLFKTKISMAEKKTRFEERF